MCGIAGALTSSDDGTDLVGVVRRMVAALGHRGPDGVGVVRCRAAGADVALGHTRLAILDLSDRASQPMPDPAGDCWITFNGEVVNFADLRAELETSGHRFRTESDTEVVLAAYLEWGEGFVERLRGMFALGIWDGRRQQLLLARDRIGIKPLYFSEHRGTFVFASEVRALLASGLVDRAVDPVALDQYLAYQTAATPRTLVRGVSMLEPGHLLRWRAGAASTRRAYWRLLERASPDAARSTREEGQATVRALLEDAVRTHLVSDVPVGVFLSGGVDSSAVAALVRRAGATPRTFAVTFPGAEGDEGAAARSIARALDADHTEIPIDHAGLLGALPDALASFDHPSGDGVNTYIVSRAVRATGIKVALSGLGGDELFGGYSTFTRLARVRAWSRLWRRTPDALRSAAAAAVRGVGPSSVVTDKTAALLESDGSLPQTYPIFRQVFGRRQRAALRPADAAPAAGDAYVDQLDEALTGATALPFAARVSYAELSTYMHDVLLRDTDQMSMRHGLEVRVPLLDHVLAEYVIGLPDDVRRADEGPKRLLVDAVRGDLPAGSLDRPKQGFVLPLDAWMRGEFRGFCEAQLFDPAVMQDGLFEPAVVRSHWRAFLDRRPSVTWSRLWTLIAFNAWRRETGVR